SDITRYCITDLTLSLKRRPTPSSTLFPYTTLFRSQAENTEANEETNDEAESNNEAETNENNAENEDAEPAETQETNLIYWIVIGDRKSTRLNSSHVSISYAVFCLKKKRNVI